MAVIIIVVTVIARLCFNTGPMVPNEPFAVKLWQLIRCVSIPKHMLLPADTGLLVTELIQSNRSEATSSRFIREAG